MFRFVVNVGVQTGLEKRVCNIRLFLRGCIRAVGDVDSSIVCVACSYCQPWNEWYHQCVPGVASSTTSTATKPIPTITITTTTLPSPTTTTGFVKTSGTGFTLNDVRYVPVG